MALYKISSSRVNNIEADQYAGSVVEEGLIWYDPNDGLLRLYNGNVGGYIINSGGTGGNPITVDYNGNVVTNNLSVLNFTGNGVTVSNSGGNVTVDIVRSPSNLIELGTSNVRVWPDGNVTVSVLGTANAASFGNNLLTVRNLSTANVTATGNISAAYFVGDGSKLSNIQAGNISGNVANATYAELANVANFANVATTALSANTANVALSANVANFANAATTADTANIANFANAAATANVANTALTANFANAAATANVANTALFANASNTAVTVSGNIQANITQVGTLVSLSVSGNIQTPANISGNYLFGNGYYLTGISGGSGNASFPPQTGNAGLVLMTNGTDVYWNSGLAASYTFEGGAADSVAGALLDGGGAAADYTGEAAIYGGEAASDYSLTLSSLALTGQYEDLVDAPDTTPVPATANSAGQKGQMAFDSSYLYVCIAENTWRRATLNSW